MDLQLKGKRALVTGSSSGIGAGIARLLAEEGCDVVVHGRNSDKAEAVAESIRSTGGRCAIALGDLSTNAGADAVAQAATAAFGSIDILINNAGGSSGGSASDWWDVTEDQWVQTHEMNAVAAARMVKRLLPGMKKQGWGRIVQIASAAGTQPIPMGPDYGATKAAMINMTVSLAKALGDCGVTSNCISPGAVLTPAVEHWVTSLAEKEGFSDLPFEEQEKRVASRMAPTLLGRIGRTDDIAMAVCMVVSPRMNYMTGANIRVDGGQVQSIN